MINKFTSDGKFLMLALDHRESFKKLMNPDNPNSVADQEIITLKSAIIESVIDQVSGVLIDPELGLKAYINRRKPFLLPVEKSGYKDMNGERTTELQYWVQQLIDWGASGAKLLLHFNPNVPSRETQLMTARKVLEECQARNFPLFLEVVTYEQESSLHPRGVKLKSELVLDSIMLLLQYKVIPDVFKLEYAGDFASCQKVTAILGSTPWILLSRGDAFDTFQQELKEAMKAGAKGFLAGRALWQEALSLQKEAQEEFLNTTLPKRLKTLIAIAKR